MCVLRFRDRCVRRGVPNFFTIEHAIRLGVFYGKVRELIGSLGFENMSSKCFRVAAPSLALGLLLVTQALGRPQSQLLGLSNHERKFTAPNVPHDIDSAGNHALGQGGAAPASTISTNKNIMNRILNNEQLAIGRNERLLGQQDQINQNLFRLDHTTPTNAAMARIIHCQIAHQLALFQQLSNHFSLNQVHIGNTLPLYDARFARSLAALGPFAPGRPALIAYMVDSLRLQMMLSSRLQVIQTLPPATPYMPSS